MCDLCSSIESERKEAADKLHTEADEMISLATDLRRLAYGRLNPHSNEAHVVGSKARHIIRYLVEEWM